MKSPYTVATAWHADSDLRIENQMYGHNDIAELNESVINLLHSVLQASLPREPAAPRPSAFRPSIMSSMKSSTDPYDAEALGPAVRPHAAECLLQH